MIKKYKKKYKKKLSEERIGTTEMKIKKENSYQSRLQFDIDRVIKNQ